MISKCILWIAVFCLTALSAAAQDIRVIETGTFHGEEITATDGEIWLGVYKGGDMLMPSILSINSVYDAIIDAEGESSGASIKVPGMGNPMFLVTGSGFVQARPIKTIEYMIGEINPKEEVQFDLDGKKYRLFVRAEKEGKDYFIQDGSSLVLSDGTTEQILYEVEECSFCRWSIDWAGDIDADGKPDLYLYLTDHYNVANKKLFLSTKAGNGKLVKEVAEFTTTGC